MKIDEVLAAGGYDFVVGQQTDEPAELHRGGIGPSAWHVNKHNQKGPHLREETPMLFWIVVVVLVLIVVGAVGYFYLVSQAT